ncbi:MAG: mercury(II) reductase [Candidatus Hodarchaeales archaeon]
MNDDKEFEELELEVLGMTCDSCAVHVSKALRGIKGVQHVDVPGWNLNKAFVQASLGVTDEAVITAVKSAGYETTILSKKRGNVEVKSDSTFDYDLAVIGTGGAGMSAAIKGAELGKKAVIIESGTVGGTCVNIGCVPSKLLIRAAEMRFKADHHPFRGVKTSSSGINWKEVIAQKDELIIDLRQSKYLDILSSYGEQITLLRGRAKLEPGGYVVINNRRIRAGKIVIATGARPHKLPIQGVNDSEILTSTTAMELVKQPVSLIIIGGRAIALELGQMFARFGTEVTILQRSSRLIPDHDPVIAEALAEYLREEGLKVHTGVKTLKLQQESGNKTVTCEINGLLQVFKAEQVLMATGRAPNTTDMGLKEVGVKVDDQGFIAVNDYLQTSSPLIYAAGDVTGKPRFVYVAAATGGIAAENALTANRKKVDLSILPSVIFTDPQVATVGLTEEEAKKQGYSVKVATLPLSHVPRALAARDTRGLIKLVADRTSDRLLGAHVLAAEGGEVIQTATLAVKFGKEHGVTVKELREILFPYLVQVEGLKLAMLSFEKDVTKLSCCAG